MKAILKKILLAFILFPVFSYAQDVSNINLGFSLASNLSMIQSKMAIPGLNVSVSYQIDRTMNAGVHAGYIYNSHKIEFVPYNFVGSINVDGDSATVKEVVTRSVAGAHFGYTIMPFSGVSLFVQAQLNYIILEKKLNTDNPLNDEAKNTYYNTWKSNNAIAFGLAAGLDFNLSRSTVLRLGVNATDFTSALFADKDNRFAKEIIYSEGYINTITPTKKGYTGLDINLGLIFKLGNKKK